MERGGFLVTDSQIVQLKGDKPNNNDDDDDGDDDKKLKGKYKFDLDFNLLEAKVPLPVLIAFSTDASGNQSDPVSVIPPYLAGNNAAKMISSSEAVTDGASNYPNPFNNATQIAYRLPMEGDVVITIYNMQGQVVRSLVNEYQVRGNYEVQWDGRDQGGYTVSSGIYIYRLVSLGLADRHVETRRMLFIK